MIKLTKADPPAWLRIKQEDETEKYIQAPKGAKPSPWRNSHILLALKAESHGKCIYCEGAMEDLSYGAVEHIAPKSRFPQSVLLWENLGLVCSRCNANKSDYWTDSPDLQILNPYVDSAENHIEFIGPVVAAKPGSTRGENTIRRLKLQREDLVMSKMRRIEDVEYRLVGWHREIDPEVKSLLAEDIRDACSLDREFSATLTAYARYRGFPV